MSFLMESWLGIRVLIWLIVGLQVLVASAIAIYFLREKIRGAYYRFRFPEKTIKIYLHYASGLYKVYWRLIPDRDIIKVDKKKYLYDEDMITKEHDLFAIRDKKQGRKLVAIDQELYVRDGKPDRKIMIKGNEYNFYDYFAIQEKGKKYMELHYCYNNPFPLDFKVEKGEVVANSKQLDDFMENNLIKELMTLKGKMSLMMFLIALTAINLLATVFIIAKMMGWLE